MCHPTIQTGADVWQTQQYAAPSGQMLTCLDPPQEEREERRMKERKEERKKERTKEEANNIKLKLYQSSFLRSFADSAA
jgi:hypothetical protein